MAAKMNTTRFPILVSLFFCAEKVDAQLAVTVTPPKVVGQKAVVQLKMKNYFGDAVKSARAVCFLLDEQGKMIGQSTKWVIGQNKTGLESKAETTFNFVITSPQPFTTTNLTAKVTFSRVVMDGGKLAEVSKDVNITSETK
jgi:hypothetical protein